ncbi:MAG: lysophospholipid acyltransferase family protein [Saprospiraceae bacterium]|nr:lysophospholipid acyltransferase family protein [Saprospiraceae bacterium]
MGKALSKFILWLVGWKVEGGENLSIPKAIVAVVPHTSNWDFPLGIFSRMSVGKDIKFLAKKSLFHPLVGWFFRGLGGYPVDRSKSSNFVDSVVQLFNEKEHFLVSIAPEGTRKKVDRLKTGFYYMAKGANIPIVPTRINYKTRRLTFGKPLYPSDDIEADFKKMDAFFRQAVGKNPELGYLHE